MVCCQTSLELCEYVSRQVNSFFPDNKPVKDVISRNIEKTLEKMEFCYSRTKNKYYSDNEQTIFDYQHTDQFASFLYFLSNTIFKNHDDLSVAKKFIR